MLPPRVARAFRLAIRGRAQLAADVDEEVAFHLAERVAQLERRGLSPEAAREEAIRRFGPAHLTRLRDARGWSWRAAPVLHTTARRREDRMRIREALEDLGNDLRHGWRALQRAPGFTAVIALTLALGLGANVTIFSVVDAVLLRPLPYPAAERLVVLGDGQAGREIVPASYPEFVDWRARGGSALTAVGAYFTNEAALTHGGEPEVLTGVRASASVHRLLGTAVLHGRPLAADDDARASERVLMVSERLWRRRFGADPALVGRALTINDHPWTVVGILRDDARAVLPTGLVTGASTDVWFPLRLDEVAAPRGLHFLTVLAQRRPDVPLDDARRRMSRVATELQGTGVTEHGIALMPAAERLVGDVRERLGLLLGAVGLVLLIACANVANLLLARGAARQREVAVHLAIGASRGRVVMRTLTESLLRALLGGALGVAVAAAATAGIRRWFVGHLPRAAEVAVDGRVVLFGLGLSIVTGLLFGMLPAVRASRHDPAQVIREGGRGLSTGPRGDRVRSTLVVTEVALSFVLLACAGLLLKSFGRLTAVDRGFDARQTVTALVVLPGTRYADSTRQVAFFDALVARVAQLPGVRGAALASNLPVEGGTNGQFQIEGRPFPPNDQPLAEKRVVSRDYFQVIGARLVAGRAFDTRDVFGAPGAMVVNESFARRWFAGRSAVGQRVAFSWGTEGMQTIVGVVADVREGPLDRPAPPAMYVPVTQRPADALYLLVRAVGAPEPLVPAIRQTVLALDPGLPLANVRTMDAVLASGVARPRLSAMLVGALAALAVVLAAVGLYGVIGFLVVQRTREFGIRTALGARPGDVLRLVLRQGGALVAGGLALGLLLTVPLTRVLEGQLFAVRPTDPGTLLGVGILLLAVGVGAAAGPAWRAARTSPVVTLRHD